MESSVDVGFRDTVTLAVLGIQLHLKVLKVLSNLNNSLIP